MATLALVNGISITSVNAMENDESSQEAAQTDFYIMADSDSRYLQEAELYGLPVQVLNYARTRSMQERDGYSIQRNCRNTLGSSPGMRERFRQIGLMTEPC